MNILILTNTYKPIMGGLEKSVEAFALGFRKKGHHVIIVAPEYKDAPVEEDVIRVPAIQNFNGTDFSVHIPMPHVLDDALGDFKPDVVHSNHPFLVGDTALRIAKKNNVPLFFTYHTLFEQYTHYLSAEGGDSEALKRFVVQLSIGYAGLADQVFAPSESIMNMLKEKGVRSLIDVVPTGIEPAHYAKGDGQKVRSANQIPADAFVAGHLGRLAPEKNLEFLAQAVILFLKKNPRAHFLLVGKGPSEESVIEAFKKAGLENRFHFTGPLNGQDLVDAYHAMDVFAFASQSETQGLVLVEAMASGVPVVGVDAPGVREVIRDKENGRLIKEEIAADFAAALEWVADLDKPKKSGLREESLKTADSFSMDKCVDKALKLYGLMVLNKEFIRDNTDDDPWSKTLRLFQGHWELTKNLTKAATEAILNP